MLIDDEWLISQSKELFHLCKGVEIEGKQNNNSRTGFWPVKNKEQCPICKVNVPNHVKLHLNV